ADAAHARGVRVIAGTLAPFEGTDTPNYFSAEKERRRLAVNEWLRAARQLDGLVDADAVLRDPAKPARLRAQFDSGDHLHPSAAGNAALARAFPRDACAPREDGAASDTGATR